MTQTRRRYLAIDLGASSGRALVGTMARGRLDLREIHRFANEPVAMGGTLYWDFPRLWQETCEALRRCARAGASMLDGIGIDTWGVDFGLLGRDGRLNGNPLCYRDAVTEGAVEVITGALPPSRFYALTGMAAGRVSTLAQLLGLRREAGGARLREADTLLMMPGLFRYFLCGHKAVERTAAGSSLLTNVRTGRWCGSVLKTLDLPGRLLPPIVPSGTVVGKLDSDLARRADLNQAPVIAVAGHDTLSAAVAAPHAGDDTVFLAAGTWSVVGALRPRPLTTAEVMDRGFVNELAPAGVLLAKNLIGLYLFENLRRAMVRRGRALSYEDMIRAVAASPPLVRRLDVGAPEFFVTDDPMESVREHLRRTGQKQLRGWPAVARVILEGLAWSYRGAVRELADLTGCSFTRISMVGGGTHNRVLCQMTADATGLEVLAGPSEATAAGNIGLQAVATGVLEDTTNLRDLVRESLPIRRYVPHNADAWNRSALALGLLQ